MVIGCSDSCQVQNGYRCEGEPSVCEGICGDGDLQNGEDCDWGMLPADDPDEDTKSGCVNCK